MGFLKKLGKLAAKAKDVSDGFKEASIKLEADKIERKKKEIARLKKKTVKKKELNELDKELAELKKLDEGESHF